MQDISLRYLFDQFVDTTAIDKGVGPGAAGPINPIGPYNNTRLIPYTEFVGNNISQNPSY